MYNFILFLNLKMAKCILNLYFLSFYESVFFTFEALRIGSQKTNTYVHLPYDVQASFYSIFQLIKPCYKQKTAKNIYKVVLFGHSMKVYFSHLRHLELTHRKLTHMYMFLMMSGICLQYSPVDKTML